ncbi:ABC transporter substrate-binding protein [Microlunatus sp. GCM10028923]|uniref:ABC transporter substrate-binding protein n=1 Tax=Microlunatus sp. GCM10028923 TaxID=3273400 RepID=UPI003617BB81
MAATVALSGCVDAVQGGGGGGEIDHSVLNLALAGEPGSWNPAMLTSAGDVRWRWMAVYDTLLRAEPGGKVVPGAAESYDFSEDAKTLTMKLRSGMKFSDGNPVDSAAVKASIVNMQNGGGTDASRVAGLTIETPDDLTVILKSPEPRGQLPVFMSFSTGVVASPAALKSKDVDNTPVSSGPYVLDVANTTSGSVYTFNKRPDHWEADRYPYQKLVLTVMTDLNARVNALRAGQVSGASIDREVAAEAEASGIKVTKRVNSWLGLYIMDRNGKRTKALGDKRVRQAMNMVFNRDDIATGLYQGEATPTTQIFNPETPAYLKELDGRYPYDVEKAKQLMADAGYADGFSLTIPAQSPDTDQANPLIIQQLGLLNIKVTEKPLSGPTAINDILSGKFDVLYAWIGMADPLFDTVQSLVPDAVWNTSKATDPRLSEMVTKAEVLTGAEADANFQEINRFCVEEAWFVPWVNAKFYFGLDREDRISGNTDYFQTTPLLWDFQ